jgi:hypothetical protein
MGAYVRDWHERAPLICGINAYVGAKVGMRMDEGFECTLAQKLV